MYVVDNKIISNSQLKICHLVDNVAKTLSELVQERLQALKMSKSELARRVGVSRSYIVNIANGTAATRSGQYKPSPDVISKMAKALEIPESSLLAAIGYGDTNGLENTIPQELLDIDWNIISEISRKEIIDFAKFKAYRDRVENSESPADLFEFEQEWRERMKKESRTK